MVLCFLLEYIIFFLFLLYFFLKFSIWCTSQSIQSHSSQISILYLNCRNLFLARIIREASLSKKSFFHCGSQNITFWRFSYTTSLSDNIKYVVFHLRFFSVKQLPQKFLRLFSLSSLVHLWACKEKFNKGYFLSVGRICHFTQRKIILKAIRYLKIVYVFGWWALCPVSQPVSTLEVTGNISLIFSKRNQDFSVNFTTIWNFLNTVLFCEGLECMEVCSFMSMVSFFLPDLTFQCLLKPSILVSGSCKRRREIKAQKFRAHFYPEQYCFLEVKSSPADPCKVSLRRSVGWTQEQVVIWLQTRPFLSFFLYV